MKLRRSDWSVAPVELKSARAFIAAHHYAQGSSHTCVFSHGLFDTDSNLCGAALWLPPTRVAAESVNKQDWKMVLSLSRLAVAPHVPSNACSFFLSRSVRLIRATGRFKTLVTYACSSQNHSGGIYRASGWTHLGSTDATPMWHDANGKQVAAQSTKTRSVAEMKNLGYTMIGRFKKEKFVLHLRGVPAPGTKMSAAEVCQ